MAKFNCSECGWGGDEGKVLTAPNPFADDNETMMGCPDCGAANQMRRACDEPGCFMTASNGTSTTRGYVWSCYQHIPPKS